MTIGKVRIRIVLLQLASSKICQDQRTWKYQTSGRNPYSKEFHEILKKSKQRSSEDIVLA